MYLFILCVTWRNQIIFLLSKRWLSGKRIPRPMQEMPVQFLGREDPLEQEMATHSGILAWEIPWTEESGELQSRGLAKESDMTWLQFCLSEVGTFFVFSFTSKSQ